MRSTAPTRQAALMTLAVLTVALHSASPDKISSAVSMKVSKHSRRQIDPSLYAPAFLPTPLPPLTADEGLAFAAPPPRQQHKLSQPKKPVYHYTPIKPFSDEELSEVYKGKGRAPPTRDTALSTRYGGRQLFQGGAVLGEGPFLGPQVHEYSAELPPAPKPILPPTPIAPEPVVHVGPGVQLQVALPPPQGPLQPPSLIPDTELVDIKAIRLGEAVGVVGGGGVVGGTSAVVQRQNPAHEKYHFEYRVRDPVGEFGHAEAKDGHLTTGGYDVNLHKTHVQSVRYYVDSKEVPIYAHQYHHFA